jgi:hypothetical protein
MSVPAMRGERYDSRRAVSGGAYVLRRRLHLRAPSGTAVRRIHAPWFIRRA